MIETRLHGRGGQGVVIASLILAKAAQKQGFSVQAFPEFGVERRGAPLCAFLRLDENPIRIRCRITSPDHLMVFDPYLLQSPVLVDGFKPSGTLTINIGTGSNPASQSSGDGDKAGGLGRGVLPDWLKTMKDKHNWKIFGVEASGLAASLGIGSASSPVANTAMAGAFARATGIVSLDSIIEAMHESFGAEAAKNIEAAKQAYEKVRRL
ncbi:MAG: 2-oxoacid:acceptor oxidoreductase family protein [Elusimicrobia bacterium]|nr:2-oxoacid:acceptor oxidoreductase family protein [Elusimicrobiota bacterium]